MNIIWLILKIIAMATFIVTLILVATSRTTTRPFTDKKGNPAKDSIAEELYLTLGGIKQWTLLRGRNINNPLLLFLHGGPGTPEHGLLRYYNSELENHFVVVGWDQRGAGKTYSSNISPEKMKIAYFISDLHELIEYLKKRFKQDKVYILGKSWGSLLGILYAQKYPENVAAYLGVGQISNMQKSELLSYEFTLAEAKRRSNKKALMELQSIKSPQGSSYKDIIKERKWLTKFGGFIHGRAGYLLHWLPKILTVDEYAWPDLIRLMQGSKISLRLLWNEIYNTNLFKQVPSLKIPVYFFLGRHDHCTSSILAAEYLAQLTAPIKKIIWFENSGHNPPFEESEKFNKSIITEIGKQPNRTRNSRNDETKILQY